MQSVHILRVFESLVLAHRFVYTSTEFTWFETILEDMRKLNRRRWKVFFTNDMLLYPVIIIAI